MVVATWPDGAERREATSRRALLPWHLLWHAGRVVACGGLEPVAVAGGRQHGGVVHDPVDDGGGGRGIEKHLGPASERQIRGHHEAAALVALTDEAEQQVGAGLVERHVADVRKDQAETSVLFELISSRYEDRSLLVTANQPFGEWGSIFPEQAMTLAAIDRLVHRATIFELNVESYRRRSAVQTQRRRGRPLCQ